MPKSSSTADRVRGKEYLVECEFAQTTCQSVEEAVNVAFKALRRWCRSRTECKYKITDAVGKSITPKQALLVLEKEPQFRIRADGTFLGATAHIWEKKWYEEDHARSMKSLGNILSVLGPNVTATFPKARKLK